MPLKIRMRSLHPIIQHCNDDPGTICYVPSFSHLHFRQMPLVGQILIVYDHRRFRRRVCFRKLDIRVPPQSFRGLLFQSRGHFHLAHTQSRQTGRALTAGLLQHTVQHRLWQTAFRCDQDVA